MFGLGTWEIILLSMGSLCCLSVLGLVALAYIVSYRIDKHDDTKK